MESIHFCGGLPRSGSTVLMNILGQNSSVFTTGTCALYDILSNNIVTSTRSTKPLLAMSVDQADRAMYGFVHGAVKGWFEALTDKPTIISKRHGWSSLFHLFPQSKFICLVRDIRDVIESLEKINRNTSILHSYDEQHGTLVPAMCLNEKYAYYFHSPRCVSTILQLEIVRMIEIHRQDPSKVMFIRYEDFTKEPNKTLKDIYGFLGINPVTHNLLNIPQSELIEHDNLYHPTRADHRTHSEFKYYTEPQRILPDGFHERIIQDNRWFYETFYPDVLS